MVPWDGGRKDFAKAGGRGGEGGARLGGCGAGVYSGGSVSGRQIICAAGEWLESGVMPRGLVDTLTESELLDLLAYLTQPVVPLSR